MSSYHVPDTYDEQRDGDKCKDFCNKKSEVPASQLDSGNEDSLSVVDGKYALSRFNDDNAVAGSKWPFHDMERRGETVKDSCGHSRRHIGEARKVLADLSQNYYHEPMISGYARMASFQDWPEQLVQKGSQLARRGFFYSGVADKVVCAWCGLRLWKWSAEDDIDFEHNRFSPSCAFLKITCPVRFDTDMRPVL
ncbi:baculoviral IAP repeat-containing protein 7-B-like [Haliotis asinina]|uniref:baculoviral IAP repeat-containing protein 7-B-like n=1 Tax=Haliotis asinina TaxID=109174 RepID=UPI0035319A69